MNASVNQAVIASANGLSPIRHQATIRTNSELFPYWTLSVEFDSK